MNRIIVFTCTALFLLWMVGCIEAASFKKKILDEIFTDTMYDKRVPPGIDFGELNEERPTNVTVQLFVTQMYSVDVNEMDFSISFFLRQKWKDYRLQFNSTNETLQLSKDDIDRIWTPDTYFPNSKEGKLHEITKPNTLMHIKPDGTVLYSLRLSAKLGCNMEFHLYPLDVQNCKIRIESYGFTSKELMYYWETTAPVVINSESLPLYNTNEDPRTVSKFCNTNLFQDGFSCLEVELVLKRSIGYYMTEAFIPDILIVTLSWVSFWLHPLAVPGRITLGAVTILTMASQGSASRRHAPRVSYIKAIDVWSLFQIVFVFAALVEFSFVNVLARRKVTEEQAKQIEKEKRKCRESQGNSASPDNDEHLRPFLAKAKRMDRISRIAFPASYLFFNFMFWVIVSNV